MRKYIGLLVMVFMVGCYGTVQASTIDINWNYTADNAVISFSLFGEDGTLVAALPLGSNSSWQTAKSQAFTIDLSAGEAYYLAWNITNQGGTPTQQNPMAFLADFTVDNTLLYTSNSTWFAGLTTGSLPTSNAESYGLNGGNNIWTTVNNGPVQGISLLSEWIGFGVYPGGGDNHTASSMTIAARFVVAEANTNQPVPEPATMLLMGLGAVGVAYMRRRNASRSE